MQPTDRLPIISVLSLVTVEYGGWALLGFITGREGLGEFRQRFFRAGHAHAGVLLVLSLVYFLYLDRTDLSTGLQWVAGMLLLAGLLAQRSSSASRWTTRSSSSRASGRSTSRAPTRAPRS